MALLVLLLFLWQYGLLHFTLPTICTQATCARKVENLPPYVVEYGMQLFNHKFSNRVLTQQPPAPLVWLDIGEGYFPSDIYAQVENTDPNINFTTISGAPTPLTLDNLDVLNGFGNNGRNVFLTSRIDVTTDPIWLDGIVPDSHGKTKGAVSCAIIVNDHGSGRVDAFYMYFYAYNLGNTVLFRELGNHIGDWEHNMIRFQDRKPIEMWFSQHGNGQAFTYDAVEKKGIRPVTYSAMGSHANYAIAGIHDHTIPDLNLPAGFLLDYTSQGMLWDPTLSAYFYNYNPEDRSFSSAGDGSSPLGAMNYKGRWGDEQYPDDDPRQELFFGFYKYVGGPTGPWDKQLNRTLICPSNGIPCIVRKSLSP